MIYTLCFKFYSGLSRNRRFTYFNYYATGSFADPTSQLSSGTTCQSGNYNGYYVNVGNQGMLNILKYAQ